MFKQALSSALQYFFWLLCDLWHLDGPQGPVLLHQEVQR